MGEGIRGYQEVEVQKAQGEEHRVGGKESVPVMVPPASSLTFALASEVLVRRAPLAEGGMSQMYLERSHETIDDWKRGTLVEREESALPWALDCAQRVRVIQWLYVLMTWPTRVYGPFDHRNCCLDQSVVTGKTIRYSTIDR
jgi:hypothetical protein